MVEGNKGLEKGGECSSLFCATVGANSFTRGAHRVVYACQHCAMVINEADIRAQREPTFVIRQDSKG